MSSERCALNLGAASNVIAISGPENWQKVDNLNPYISETNDIDKKSLCFFNIGLLLTIFFMVMFIYSTLNKIFSYFFSFFLSLSTFKPQSANGSYRVLIEKFWCQPEIGSATMGDPYGLQKFKLFSSLKLDQ